MRAERHNDQQSESPRMNAPSPAPSAGSFGGQPAPGVTRQIGLTLDMIKFSHTIFGLPFALLGAALAADGWPQAWPLFWIVAACVFARSAAMAFNRLHDLRFDRRNPRTREWPLSAGRVSVKFARGFMLVCVVGFVFSAWMLNLLALVLSPIALAVLLGYSVTKRFTSASHFFLGLALGIAPVGAWVGVRGDLSLTPVLLGLGVLLWTAGFDIIYSCQDEAFDRDAGLYSIPARLGRRRALAISALCHAAAIILFLGLTVITSLGTLYLIALTVCALLLAYEQSLVSPNDLSKLGRAFFTVNGFVSGLLFVGGLIDVLT